MTLKGDRVLFEEKYHIAFREREMVRFYDHHYSHVFEQKRVDLVKLVRRSQYDPKSVAQTVDPVRRDEVEVNDRGQSKQLSVTVVAVSSVLMVVVAYLFYYFYLNNITSI